MVEPKRVRVNAAQPTVLVVEDDALMAAALGRTLRALGLQVAQAANASEALRWLDAGGVPAVVMSDNRMPGMSGVSLLERIAQLAPDALLVLHTGDADVTLALEPGMAICVLAKPVPPRLLERLLGAFVRRPG